MSSSPSILKPSLPRHGIVLFLIAVSLIFSLGCSTQMHYYRAKTSYVEEDYEAALRSVDLALQAKPHNEDFVLLRSDIIIALYRSYGHPTIAFHLLSRDEANTISYMDSLHKRKLLMNEIRGKFTVPIVLHFSDNISEAGRQLVRSTVAQRLQKSCDHGFCELSLLEHTDSTASVVLEILLESVLVTQTKEEPRSVRSEYKSGVRMEPNPEYLRQVVTSRGLIGWQQQLTDLQINPGQRPLWDAENFVLNEQWQDVNRRVEESKRKLASTPARIPRPVFTAYQFLERDHVLDIEIAFKYRLVDLCHRTVWKEEAVRYTDTNRLKEISNVHPDDASDLKNHEIAEEDIDESLSGTKEQMYSKLAERVQKEIARVFYYRARDYQTLGFHADAWEHYYVFLKSLCAEESDEEVCEEAMAMAAQDPFTLPLSRADKIPSDRKPPAVESYGSDF